MYFLQKKVIILIPSALDADGMGDKPYLQFNLSVEEPFTADNLELEGAFKVGGEVEGSGANRNHDGINDIVVLIHQLQRTTITRRVEHQRIPVYIYGRREDGGFGISRPWLSLFNSSSLERNGQARRRTYGVHERGHREDAEKGENLFHCNDCIYGIKRRKSTSLQETLQILTCVKNTHPPFKSHE